MNLRELLNILFTDLNMDLPIDKMALATELYVMLLSISSTVPVNYSLPLARGLILESNDIRFLFDRISEEYQHYEFYLEKFNDDEAEAMSHIANMILDELGV